MLEKIRTTWAKIGVAGLMITGFVLSALGYTMSPEDQAAIFELVMAGITGVGSIIALFLKVKDSKPNTGE
jgi:hypothetical protein